MEVLFFYFNIFDGFLYERTIEDLVGDDSFPTFD